MKTVFWNSLRHQNDGMANARNQKSTHTSQREKFSPVKQSSFQSLSKEAVELREGDIIEHERFGRGVVSGIESTGSDKRAFVDFDSAGRKQLLLKFAKFKIVK
jgi:DNA helicase-2/ATP-dependent DNA helicase PcrA